MTKITAIIFSRGESVKDVITSCLNICNYFIIVETSNSGANKLISQDRINGIIYKVKWVNYEYNYNEALSYSRRKMGPFCDYLLWISTNEVVDYYSKREFPRPRNEFGISINVHTNGFKYNEVRLFTPGFKCQFEGYSYPKLVYEGTVDRFKGLSINRANNINMNQLIENRELLYRQILDSDDTNTNYNWGLPIPCDYKFIDDRTLFYIGYCSYLVSDLSVAIKALRARIKWQKITGLNSDCEYEKWYSKVILLKISSFNDNKLLLGAINLYEKPPIDDLSYSYIKDNSIKEFIREVLTRNGRILLID